MRNLLIALLLAIFTLQATVVALGEGEVAMAAVQQLHVAESADLDSDIASHTDTSYDTSAIDELSDYLPADLSFSPGSFAMPSYRPGSPVLLSIDLPRIKPPPRA